MANIKSAVKRISVTERENGKQNCKKQNCYEYQKV